MNPQETQRGGDNMSLLEKLDDLKDPLKMAQRGNLLASQRENLITQYINKISDELALIPDEFILNNDDKKLLFGWLRYPAIFREITPEVYRLCMNDLRGRIARLAGENDLRQVQKDFSEIQSEALEEMISDEIGYWEVAMSAEEKQDWQEMNLLNFHSALRQIFPPTTTKIIRLCSEANEEEMMRWKLAEEIIPAWYHLVIIYRMLRLSYKPRHKSKTAAKTPLSPVAVWSRLKARIKKFVRNLFPGTRDWSDID